MACQPFHLVILTPHLQALMTYASHTLPSLCEAYVIPFLFGLFYFMVYHPNIDVHYPTVHY